MSTRTISFKLIVAMLFISFTLSIDSVAQDKSSGYTSVGALKVYYDVQGKGAPIILLHGAFMTNEMNWGELAPELAKTRKVIAIELQGHGHTEYSERELSLSTLASDVAAVMKDLKIDSADIAGFSFGGTVAYQFAIQYPRLTKKLVIISSTYKSEGWQKEVSDALKSFTPEFFDNTPFKDAYVKIAPDSSNWHKFVSQMIKLDHKPFNLGDANIKALKAPVLLISGDNDGVDKTVLIETYKLLGGLVVADMAAAPKSQLAIVPGKGHISLMMDTPVIFSLMNNFLK